jgi:hypothetical protein
MEVDVDLPAPCWPLANARLRGDPRGCDGGTRQDVAAGMIRNCWRALWVIRAKSRCTPLHASWGFPRRRPFPFERGSRVGRRSITSAGFLADIFTLIPRNERAALGEMLVWELRGRELPDDELRPHRRARVAPIPQWLANLRGDSSSVQQNNHS